mgnify:CR=1 FL=1
MQHLDLLLIRQFYPIDKMTRQEISNKLDEFINRYQDQQKGYPTDNEFKGQCLSICKIYIKEVFGINPPPSGSNSAFGYWSNFPQLLPTKFVKISRTAVNFPQKGDIPIWKPTKKKL